MSFAFAEISFVKQWQTIPLHYCKEHQVPKAVTPLELDHVEALMKDEGLLQAFAAN